MEREIVHAQRKDKEIFKRGNHAGEVMFYLNWLCQHGQPFCLRKYNLY